MSAKYHFFFFTVSNQKTFLILIPFIFVALSTFSQNRFQKAIGTSSEEIGRGVIRLENGNFAVLSQLMQNNDEDFGIIIMDENFNLLSSDVYHLPGKQEPLSLKISVNGGYLIGGNDFSSTYQKSFICKINDNFEVEWAKYASYDNISYIEQLIEDPNGFIYAIFCFRNPQMADNVLIKFDQAGNVIWQKTFGIPQNDHLSDIYFSADGTLNIVGDIWDGGAELILLKISPEGQVKSQKSLFSDNQHYYPFGIVNLDNGEFVTYGNDQTYSKSFIIKFNSSMQPVWKKFIGSGTMNIQDTVYLENAIYANGFIYFVGNTNYAGDDIVMLCMNPDGDIIWSKTYGSPQPETIKVLTRSAVFADSEGLYFCATTKGFGSGNQDIYLVSTDLNGNSGCFEEQITIYETGSIYTPYDIDMITNFTFSINNIQPVKQPSGELTVTTLCEDVLLANFNANATNICQGDTIGFFDLSSNNPVAWLWTFEGGIPATSTEKNPTGILYDNPGSFDVTLIISKENETDTLVKQNYIQVAPGSIIDLGEDQCIPPDAGYVALNAGTGYSSYLWSNGSVSNWIIADEPGIYWVEVTNDFGCTGADTVKIFPGLDVLPDLGPDQSICNGQTITVNVGSEYEQYIWSTGETSGSIQVTSPGLYWVKVSNDEGCEASDTISITSGLNPGLNLGNDILLCLFYNIILDAGTGYESYLWSNGSTSQQINVNEPGIYWVYVIDPYGCSGSDTLRLMLKHLTIDLGEDIIKCEGESVILDAGNGYSEYLWSDGETTSQIELISSESMWLSVTDDEGCIGIDTISVNFSKPPLLAEINKMEFNKVFLTGVGGYPPYEYSMNGTDFQISQEFEGQMTGFQHFYIRDSLGCTNDTIINLGEEDIIIPNFFTPNDDFINDTWEIEGLAFYPDAVIRIFDRYGKLLTTYRGSNKGWDGKYMGQAMPSDTYWYQISFPAFTKKVYTGNVTIKR